MGFKRTNALLEHRNVLAPDNLMFGLANERFRDELGVLCSDLSNEETLLVIRTLEFSIPEGNGSIAFGKNIMRRCILLHAEMISHLVPVSVALSRVDPKHFGEWQCESIKASASLDSESLWKPSKGLKTEQAMASWHGYERRLNISDPRIDRAAGHLLLLSAFAETAGPGAVPVDRSADYEWFGANWEHIVPLWSELRRDKDFSRAHVERLIAGQEAVNNSVA